ncbi:MAG: hypothetical protein ACW98F_14205 [Candidatus Hodarchaeales archaeon]|jgi:hypothetical protein
MAKSRAIFFLIGMLIGGGFLIFGYISWTSMDGLETKLDNLSVNSAWYSGTISSFTVTPAFTLLEIPDLIVSFTLESNSTIYLSFTCQATIFSSSGMSRAWFYFKIDGEVNYDPLIMVGIDDGGSTADHFSVKLQKFIENMDTGNHNVTIALSSGNPVNPPYVKDASIFVQSFAM